MPKYTTVSITEDSSKDLKKFCSKMEMKQSEFIPLALAYFNKWGISPGEDASPGAEISKMHKRIEHIFGFLKKHEQDFIMPIAQGIEESRIQARTDIAELNKLSKAREETIISTIGEASKLIEGVQKSTDRYGNTTIKGHNLTLAVKKGLQKHSDIDLNKGIGSNDATPLYD